MAPPLKRIGGVLRSDVLVTRSCESAVAQPSGSQVPDRDALIYGPYGMSWDGVLHKKVQFFIHMCT